MHTISEELDRCFAAVEGGGWDLFLNLKHPRCMSAAYTANRYENPEEGFAVWMDEMGQEHGVNSYIRVIERRESSDIIFHTLLSGVPKGRQRFWRHRWWELTAGAAWDRPIDRPIEGLFKYFVFKKRCDIEYSRGGYLIEYRWPEHEG
jgi:hypothetical protein